MILSRIVLTVLALAGAAALQAGALDGKWKGDVKMQRKGGEKSVAMVLDLKTEGSALKGTVAFGKRSVDIEEGTVNGDTFSFVTVAKGKKGERKLRWQGTLKGDSLEVSRGKRKKPGDAVVLKRG